MISSNALNRIFHVRYNNCTGTAFLVDHGGRQYLVSAKHVFENIPSFATIEILHDGIWKTLNVSLTGVPCGTADVIVLAPALRLSRALPLPLFAGNVPIMLGQEVYFLGFPFGLCTEVGPLNGNLPLPLIKRACLSGLLGPKDERIMLLDGFNNPGFSGGPVVFRRLGAGIKDPLMVMGIISGYRFHEEPVYSNGIPLPLNSRSNTGIIIAFDVNIAIRIIEQNPNGIEIKDQDAEPLSGP